MAKHETRFNWRDPLLLDHQLTHDERMVRDTARAVLPGQARAARARGVPQREDRRRDFPRDGRARHARHRHSRAVRRRRPELRELRPGRARGRARRFRLSLDDERAGLARDGADQRVRHRGAEAEIPAEARDRRVDRLLRPDRAESRLRSRRHDDAREESRRRIQLDRHEVVDHEQSHRRRLHRLGERRRRATFAGSCSRKAGRG